MMIEGKMGDRAFWNYLPASKHLFCSSLIFLLSLSCLDAVSEDGPFQPCLDVSQLDPASYVQFVDGAEIPVVSSSSKLPLPQDVIATRTTWKISRQKFGESKTPGPRHLRIGFTEPVGVGTVLAVGDISVSVLKPDAQYPGNMGDDSQWIPAQRIEKGKITSSQTVEYQCAAWLLPTGTKTRALRFTHTAQTLDNDYSGVLQGVRILSGLFTNLAPQAMAAGRVSRQIAKINNEGFNDGWFAWENFDPKKDDRPSTIADDPEWLMLAWNEPVSLRGISFLWSGFSAAELQTYAGPEGVPPKDASDNDWKTFSSLTGVKNNYPSSFAPYFVDFGKDITTRALRLRITATTNEPKDRDAGGKRVWLGEWFAFSNLGNNPPEKAILASAKMTGGQSEEGAIPIRFSMPEKGFATLVIDDAKGMRVRNLVSETPFEAGEQTIWWDGSDDLGRDVKAAENGVYKIPFQLVAPGEYRVHGLWRKEIVSSYEFSVYSPGNPPWSTEDHTGAWIANHSPPLAAVFVPGDKHSPTGEPVVFLGCLVTEGPDAVAWVDLDGRKRGGRKWIGGIWTGAPYMAYDAGPQADPDVSVYVGTGWKDDNVKNSSILRLNTMMPTGDSKPVMNVDLGTLPEGTKMSESMRGLSVRDGVLVCSLFHLNQLILVDAKKEMKEKTKTKSEELVRIPVESPRGSAFDGQGRFLVLSGTKILRYPKIPDAKTKSETIVEKGLEDPKGITLDAEGNLYVSDWGASHQVKVFTAEGKFLRAIGNPGEPKAGPYDPIHMNRPWGITIDSKNQLWIAENDQLPRRVSVWTLDGKLVRAFYGPGKYGGGGTIDPQDRNKFYYAQEGSGAMEFRLNWEKGTSELVSVYCRRKEGDAKSIKLDAPETPIYHEGRRYFTNCYNSSPTSGSGSAVLFQDRDGIAQPVAAMGRVRGWEIFEEERFASRLPEGVAVSPKDGNFPENTFFLWCDTNGDAQVQPDEVEIQKKDCRGVTVMPDLSFCAANIGGAYPVTFGKAMRFAPVKFDERGIPRYDLSKGQVLAENVKFSASSGGSQMLADGSGSIVLSLGSGSFDARSMSGGNTSGQRWSYPSLWPGLHAGHHAPKLSFPGELIATTRMLGGLFTVGKETFWAINSDKGCPYAFTFDGLFVATLFKDVGQGKSWQMPVAERGMKLTGLTLGQENFWPTITRTSDDKVYMVDGARCSIVRLDGFDSIRRLDAGKLTVKAEDLVRAQELLYKHEAERQQQQGSGILKVELLAAEPVLDGKLNEWNQVEWVDIDRRGGGDVRGAVAIAGDRLFAAWKTGEPRLLTNTGENPVALFKTGGALDLMIGTAPNANPKRTQPVAGDIRLLITQVPVAAEGKAKGPKIQTKAVLYRAVVPGTKDADKVPFSSPWRTIYMDKVEDISSQVKLAADKDGNFEISVPLEILGLKPVAGMQLQGDIGILRGSGGETTARLYWSNKASGIVADVPSEAQLSPMLWGSWKIEKPH